MRGECLGTKEGAEISIYSKCNATRTLAFSGAIACRYQTPNVESIILRVHRDQRLAVEIAAAQKKATVNKNSVVLNLLPLSGLGWRRLSIAAGVRSFLLFQWLVFFILQPPTGILTAQEDGARPIPKRQALTANQRD
ncbi:hypothetical protein FPCIR_8133 [Fusarium pseudocircinatum]|uniref:Uncharacterized protein n=1 Tax=Fusarium pseudocircinatum TaxID=56676 RepID=A0A8H5L5W3_9HYPO|nr:hypothetical protein FPCIR_8133 [Fusarium pseudocircinatum]